MKIALLSLIYLLMIISCKRSYLDEKPDKSLMIPSTLSDFQGILDNSSVMNQTPILPIISSDDIYTTDAGYLSMGLTMLKNSYLWAEDIYEGTQSIPDWNKLYECVYYANIVLDGLMEFKTTPANQISARNLKGQALFYRGMSFYRLSQEFAPAFQGSSADVDLGIPIRLKTDVHLNSKRGSLRETYSQIVRDLEDAIPLLPIETEFKTRPKRDAAVALLSRVYLIMGEYEKSLAFANECLNTTKHQLIDFNALDTSAVIPFPVSYEDQNDEVIFYSSVISVSFLTNPSQTFIDSVLLVSYHEDDLRRTLYFTENQKGGIFKGNYTGSSGVFSGIALDEVYLIRAECHARMGNNDAAIDDLNTLMKNRWKKNSKTFPNFKTISTQDILPVILMERRKELVYRDLRWSDLRRLNSDQNLAKTLYRKINNITYSLKPNSGKYTFPIPDAEVVSSGIEQNIR